MPAHLVKSTCELEGDFSQHGMQFRQQRPNSAQEGGMATIRIHHLLSRRTVNLRGRSTQAGTRSL